MATSYTDYPKSQIKNGLVLQGLLNKENRQEEERRRQRKKQARTRHHHGREGDGTRREGIELYTVFYN